MIKLPQVTLACVASTHIEESKEAVNKCQEQIEFKDVVELYDMDLQSSDEYSNFILFELCNFI